MKLTKRKLIQIILKSLNENIDYDQAKEKYQQYKKRLSDCDKHKLYIRIKLNIEDYECISNLIYCFFFYNFSFKSP